MSSPDIHTLAGAYALHALPQDEERFFEAHLKACEACSTEVGELRSTAAILGAAASEAASPTLRANVLDAIAVTRQERAPVLAQVRRGARGRVPLLVAAAAIVAVIGLGTVTARLTAELQQLRGRSAEIAAVLAAEDVQTVELEGAGHRGRMIASAELDKAVFVGDALPDLTAGTTLEFWLIDDAGPHPAGVFAPDADGSAVHLVEGDLVGVDAVAVTVEPTGGSPQPTSDPFLVAEM